MEKVIKKYHKENPKDGYLVLTKMFGLSIERILDILEIEYAEIKRSAEAISIYDDMGNCTYEEYSIGCWWKWKYNNLGNCIVYEDYNGHHQKFEFKDGTIIKTVIILEKLF